MFNRAIHGILELVNDMGARVCLERALAIGVPWWVLEWWDDASRLYFHRAVGPTLQCHRAGGRECERIEDSEGVHPIVKYGLRETSEVEEHAEGWDKHRGGQVRLQKGETTKLFHRPVVRPPQ